MNRFMYPLNVYVLCYRISNLHILNKYLKDPTKIIITSEHLELDKENMECKGPFTITQYHLFIKLFKNRPQDIILVTKSNHLANLALRYKIAAICNINPGFKTYSDV